LANKLKLDLHVHVFEEFLPISPKFITISSVGKLVDKIKAAGLDGVAITEHSNTDFGYRVKEIVDTHFEGKVLIIPGRELEDLPIHFVELDLSFIGKPTFRFLAHPGYPGDPTSSIGGFQGIEIENAMHGWHIDQAMVRNLAEKHNLILLSNSDAHHLSDIGRCYTEISLEELAR
jgi:PHP family Zn ribbon phosphoesterase